MYRELLANYKNVKYEEVLKNHTTFHIGGKCKALIEPESSEEMVELVKLLDKNNIKFFVLGNGSNILVSDNGFNGVIIKLKSKFSKIYCKDDKVISQSGATLKEIFLESLEHSLTGLEFASGIPGTVGGGVYMNAGAYGGEMKDVVEYVKVLDCSTYEIKTIYNENFRFNYRHSIAQDNNYIILEVSFKLKKGIYEEIKNKYEELNFKRESKQPISSYSAGSTFKRPSGYFAAQLIEESGLKGYFVKDAGVSEKHAGFIINRGNATAKDILELIEYVKEKVFEKKGVKLETEVKILGD